MFDLSPQLDCAGRALKLDRTRVMGIVNVTPDSFSDGGDHASTDAAVAHALKLAEAGADLLDIGGESTRPGAQEVSLEEELRRVVPVIERLARQTGLPISVDTCKPEVMRAAVQAGAGMINDVCALRREGALDTAAALGVPVVLMHMLGEPRSMQEDPRYDDVVAQVHRFLAERIFAAELAGIPKKHLVASRTRSSPSSIDSGCWRWMYSSHCDRSMAATTRRLSPTAPGAGLRRRTACGGRSRSGAPLPGCPGPRLRAG